MSKETKDPDDVTFPGWIVRGITSMVVLGFLTNILLGAMQAPFASQVGLIMTGIGFVIGALWRKIRRRR